MSVTGKRGLALAAAAGSAPAATATTAAADDEEYGMDAESYLDKPEDEAEVQLDFDFVDIDSNDYFGLKTMLQNYLDGPTPFNATDMADLISQQPEVGTSVKSDEVLLAFASVVSLHQHKGRPSVQQLKRFVINRAPAEHKPALQALFDDETHGLALLVNERFVNAPPELAPPLLLGLFDEIDLANEQPESAGRFAFAHYIILTTTYQELEQGGGRTAQKRTNTAAETSFFKSEDEQFLAAAPISFSLPLVTRNGESSRATFATKIAEQRLVMVVPAAALAPIIAALRSQTEELNPAISVPGADDGAASTTTTDMS